MTPREHLSAVARKYPAAWQGIDGFRAMRGTGEIDDWPPWCFCPMAESMAVASGGDDSRCAAVVGDVAKIAALSAWRYTQGIYRFDPDVYRAVVDTPLGGDLPTDLLFRLPEWCVYVETPSLVGIDGAFVHLEHDVSDGRAELRLLLHSGDSLIAIPLHLGPWPLATAVDRFVAEAAAQSTRGLWMTAAQTAEIAKIARPIVSPVLYLCAEASEIGADGDRPSFPRPTKTRHGLRLFPPDKVRTWDVGLRTGAALRAAKREADEWDSSATGTHARPRPHIRRAHWHGYWSGSKGNSKFTVRWMPPILVNVDDADGLPTVIHPVNSNKETDAE